MKTLSKEDAAKLYSRGRYDAFRRHMDTLPDDESLRYRVESIDPNIPIHRIREAYTKGFNNGRKSRAHETEYFKLTGKKVYKLSSIKGDPLRTPLNDSDAAGNDSISAGDFSRTSSWDGVLRQSSLLSVFTDDPIVTPSPITTGEPYFKPSTSDDVVPSTSPIINGMIFEGRGGNLYPILDENTKLIAYLFRPSN